MPLSDTARALLAGRSRGNPQQPVPAPGPEQEREPSRTGFRERAQAEAERFRLATDSEYWIALCFRTPQALASFTSALGITPDGRYIPGPVLAAAVNAPAPQGTRVSRMLAGRARADLAALLASEPLPDPLAALPPVTDATAIEQDSTAELTAILAALTAPPDPSPVDVLDSPHWLAAYWQHRDAKDEWLAATGLEVIGDKYLDGHQAARLLGISL